MLQQGLLDGLDWKTMAPDAGRVGKWVWNVSTGHCAIDDTLRELTGLSDLPAEFFIEQFRDRVEPDDRPRVDLAVQNAVEGAVPLRAEFRFRRPDDSLIWLAAEGRRIDTPSGAAVLVGVNYDITHLRVSRDQADLVAREMGHRVNNILAVITGVFRGTARHCADVDSLHDAFLSRVAALSQLNGVILRTGSESVRLPDLVDAVLQPVADRAVDTEVEDVMVNGTAAQTLAMVLNELMTNGLKHGALSQQGGRIALRLSVEDAALRLIWTETASFEVTPPARREGFGMTVLNSMTAATFNGRPRFEWRPCGLEFRCDWPAREMAPA